MKYKVLAMKCYSWLFRSQNNFVSHENLDIYTRIQLLSEFKNIVIFYRISQNMFVDFKSFCVQEILSRNIRYSNYIELECMEYLKYPITCDSVLSLSCRFSSTIQCVKFIKQ